MQYNSLGSSLSYFFRAAFERVLHIFTWSISGLYILADTGCRTAPTCLQQAVLTVGCIGQKNTQLPNHKQSANPAPEQCKLPKLLQPPTKRASHLRKKTKQSQATASQASDWELPVVAEAQISMGPAWSDEASAVRCLQGFGVVVVQI